MRFFPYSGELMTKEDIADFYTKYYDNELLCNQMENVLFEPK